MIANTSLKEIGEILEKAGSVLFFPHENADADAIGSCVALCSVMRSRGKKAYVLTDVPLTEYVAFLDDGEGERFITTQKNIISEPDVCICVDCSDVSRIPGLEGVFASGKVTMVIDHHIADECRADYYYIDPAEAATAQIVWRLLGEMNCHIDRTVANALLTALSSDTGNFSYSNTTADTLRIAAELIDIGVDYNKIMVNLYQRKDIRQLRIEAAAVGKMELLAEGRIAFVSITCEMFKRYDASMEHAEEVINVIRDIEGVEYAFVLKEAGPDKIRVSMRAKTYGNVGSIAAALGGGGHMKAAGCTLKCGLDEAVTKVKAEIGMLAL